MIEHIAGSIAQRWEQKKIIEPALRDVYRYGIEILLSTAIGTLLIVVSGFWLFSPLPTLIYIFTFVPIRQYTGGYHADTYLKCNIVTILSFVFTMQCAKSLPVAPWLLAVIYPGGMLLLYFLAPAESPNKKLTKTQKKHTRGVALLLFTVICAICCLLFFCRAHTAYQTMLFTTCAVLLMLPIGTIKYRNQKKKEEETLHETDI